MGHRKMRVTHNVYIPEGTEDIEYARRYQGSEFLDELGDDDEEEPLTAEFEGVDDAESDDGPAVPQTFLVVSKTARILPDGSQVYDVVIETDNFNGVTNIDVAVTPI